MKYSEIDLDKLPYTVLAAGLMRSGSTWQYNVLRFIMLEKFGEMPYGQYYEDFDMGACLAANPKSVIIKTHYWWKDRTFKTLYYLVGKIFSSLRDRESCIESLRRFFFYDAHSAEYLYETSVENHAQALQSEACHIMRYEYMMNDKIGEVCRHLQHFDLDTSIAPKILRKVESLPMPIKFNNGKRDPDTLLHGHHITDPTLRKRYGLPPLKEILPSS